MESTIIIILIILVIILIIHNFYKRENNMQKLLDGFRREIQETIFTSRREMSEAREDIHKQSGNTLRLLIDMQSTVEKIISQQEQANKLGESLRDIFSTPKLRGNFGEIILEDLLEKALPTGMWHRQYKISEGCLVDVVIKYKDLYVPVDSKFPRDNYLNYLNGEMEEEREKHWKNFERDVISKIKEIARYIQPGMGTTDFALMFIPAERIYNEIITDRNHVGYGSKILDVAEKHNVIPVSPNNLYAFLQVVLTAMRHMEVLTNARHIHQNLQKINDKFTLFYRQYETVGRELDRAVEAYRKGDKHISHYKRELENTVESNKMEEERLG